MKIYTQCDPKVTQLGAMNADADTRNQGWNVSDLDANT